MSRPLRIEYKGAWYHVMNRGAGRRVIYKHNDHRQVFLELLRELQEDYMVEIHAYCLMDNHYHLLLHTPQGNLSRAMRHLNGVYTQRYNKIQKTDGALLKGRYKSVLIQHDAYLKQVSRYIHRNPLEARMVKSLNHYKWSSYPAYIKKTQAPHWLQTKYILSTFQNKTDRYQSFVQAGNDIETERFYAKKHTPPIYGTKDYIKRLKKRIPKQTKEIPQAKQLQTVVHPKRILKHVQQHYQIKLSQLIKSQPRQRNEARDIAIYLCRKRSQLTHSEIAKLFQLNHYTSAASAVKRVEGDIMKCKEANMLSKQLA